MFKKFLLFFSIGCLFLGAIAAVFLTWGYYYITRDLPQLNNIADYRPPAVTQLLADDGTPVAEFYEERRYPIKLKDVPVFVRNCFLAAEDASFYRHPGIDIFSILRAAVKNFQSGSASQGGSTITQQVVKNLLLTPEKKIRRKVKEAILSYQLEKRFSKDEILEIYLNQIFFGNTAYGLKSAALTYFKKNVDELTLAEAALLAALPKAPSYYSPISHVNRAKRRQRYVLDQMVKVGFATEAAAELAYREKIRVYPASMKNIFQAPYFAAEARRIFAERWKNLNIDRDGLVITTSLNLQADKFAQISLRRGLREVDKRRGWRGPIGHIKGAAREDFLKQYPESRQVGFEPELAYPALILAINSGTGQAKIAIGEHTANLKFKAAAWAKKRLNSKDQVSWISPESGIKVGDVIEVALEKRSENEDAGGQESEPFVNVILDQTPEVEGAITLLDPHSGKVLTAIGGYSYQRSVFNRATQSLRQPGSTFKPLIYLSAVDGFKYTPATIVYDQPRTFRVGDEFWTPANFDEQFMGPITLRVALEKSRNLVSVDIVSRIGIDAPIQYAKRLGISSKLGRNLSLSLGSSEVTLLELTRAYGVFAAKGVLFDSVFITNIKDRNGNILYDFEAEKLNRAQQVISPGSAFIMANMMKGVVDHGTGYRVKEIGRPVAGKTGTSNDQMDAWFIGYNPSWAAGVWVGFDLKQTIGDKETGGRAAAPIWLYLMSDFLKYQDDLAYKKLVEDSKAEADRLGIAYVAPEQLQPLDFSVPDGVDPLWIDKATGLLSDPAAPGAMLEYFIRGTEPAQSLSEAPDTSSYLESPDL